MTPLEYVYKHLDADPDEILEFPQKAISRRYMDEDLGLWFKVVPFVYRTKSRICCMAIVRFTADLIINKDYDELDLVKRCEDMPPFDVQVISEEEYLNFPKY